MGLTLLLRQSSLYASPLHIASPLLTLQASRTSTMAGSKGRKEAKVAKKEEQKQALVAKLAEQFGRSVRPSAPTFH